MIIGYHHNQIDDVKEWVAPLLDKITKKFDCGYSTEDILYALKAQDMQLWSWNKDVVLVTQVTVYPQYKVLFVLFVAGSNMGEWFNPAMEVLEKYAASLGCKYVTGEGRKGWIRYSKARGYAPGIHIVKKQVMP